MKNETIINEIQNENFKSFAYANLVLETFNQKDDVMDTTQESELIKSNDRMKEILESKIEDLEFKMTDLESMDHKSSMELETQNTMIYKLFETIDHKFLKLDYLDPKSQNLELEDITYFIKVLDHEIMDYENMIQEKISIKEILHHFGSYNHKEAM